MLGLARAVGQRVPRRMAIDVVDEAHADLVVGHLPLELVELQLRSHAVATAPEFVEVIFEPVGKEQRVAVARQPEGRAARRARRGFAGRRVRVAVSGDGRVDGRKRLLNLAVETAITQRVPTIRRRRRRMAASSGHAGLRRPARCRGSRGAASRAARPRPAASPRAATRRRAARRRQHGTRPAAVEPHERQRPGKRRVGDRDAGAVGARQPGHHRAKDLRLVHVDSPSLRYRPDRNARSGSGGDGLPGGLPRLDS